VNRKTRNAEHDQWSEVRRDPARAVGAAGTATTAAVLSGIETTAMTTSVGTGTTRTRTTAAESVTATPIGVAVVSGFVALLLKIANGSGAIVAMAAASDPDTIEATAVNASSEAAPTAGTGTRARTAGTAVATQALTKDALVAQ